VRVGKQVLNQRTPAGGNFSWRSLAILWHIHSRSLPRLQRIHSRVVVGSDASINSQVDDVDAASTVAFCSLSSVGARHDVTVCSAYRPNCK
jgi:hypothetical protein